MPLADYIARAEDIVATSKSPKKRNSPHGGPPLNHQIFISTEDPAVIEEARAYRWARTRQILRTLSRELRFIVPNAPPPPQRQAQMADHGV